MDVNGCDECGLYNGPIFKFETEKERISILTEYNIGTKDELSCGS